MFRKKKNRYRRKGEQEIFQVPACDRSLRGWSHVPLFSFFNFFPNFFVKSLYNFTQKVIF